MEGRVKRIMIPSEEGAWHFDVYDCGNVVVSVWTQKVLKQHACNNGYKRIWATSTDGKRKSFLVHRLVAMAHLEFNQDYLTLDVNHKDGNKTNNDCDNLEWVTRSKNLFHAYKTGLKGKYNKSQRKVARHKLINELVEMGYTKAFLAEAFEVSVTTIGKITLRQKHF